ncbi:MAG: CocE/NonD family hydrolase [Microthrixaceae bacterium]
MDAPTGLTLSGGVETLTITGAQPSQALTVVDAAGADRVTMLADATGQAVASYLPDAHITVQTGTGAVGAASGTVVDPGWYRVRTATALSDPVRVLAVDDVPDHGFYDSQTLNDGFGYVTTRDGTKVSVMVRLPGPPEDGPYPTVVEYSGYSPSNPSSPQPGSRIAGLLGFATVGVNMRGTGCSGGVFDVFNPAQAADGYDAIEVIASQSWVANNRVGMVGLSYAGIAQLYVASTRPPSLAAIAAQSVIDDPWRQQWPGGVYNDGFTRQWLAERDSQAQAGGQTWDGRRIAQGDTVCGDNQRLRNQNIDFEAFGRALEDRPDAIEARFLQRLAGRIDVPVFLTGGYQDEQTGARFTYLLDKFTSAPVRRFKLYNGHHPDGYSPMLITDWHDFLSFYVKNEIPEVSALVRFFSPGVFLEEFGIRAGFRANRFDSFQPNDLAGARAAYEAEAEVQVMVEAGAATDPPGATGERTRWDFDAFPPTEATTSTWYLDDGGALAADEPALEGADRYVPEAGAGARATTTAGSGTFQRPVSALNAQWEQAPEGNLVAYATPELSEDLVVAGPGWLDLWAKPGATEGAVQVDLTEVRPDGSETYVQSGWHNLAHAGLVDDLTRGFQVEYSFAAADRVPLQPDAWVHRKVPIPGVTHIFRKGSRLRVTVSAPGRSRPLWTFENPTPPPEAMVSVGRGGAHGSHLVLPTLPADAQAARAAPAAGAWAGLESPSIPAGRPECGTLRGQPCRDYAPVANAPASLSAGTATVACPSGSATAPVTFARTSGSGDGTIELTGARAEIRMGDRVADTREVVFDVSSLAPGEESAAVDLEAPAGSTAVVTVDYRLAGGTSPLSGAFQARSSVLLGPACAPSTSTSPTGTPSTGTPSSSPTSAAPTATPDPEAGGPAATTTAAGGGSGTSATGGRSPGEASSASVLGVAQPLRPRFTG